MEATLAQAQARIETLVTRQRGLERYVVRQAHIIADHKLWIEALVAMNDANAGRCREIRKHYAAAHARVVSARMAEKAPGVATPDTAQETG